MSIPATYIDCVLNSYYSGLWIDNIRDNIQRKFGFYISATLVRFWVNKFTTIIEQAIEKHHPKVGDTWVANEMRIRGRGKIFWLYDIIDDKTSFLLASFIKQSPTGTVIKELLQKASEVSLTAPSTVLVYMPLSSFNIMEEVSGCTYEQIPMETFSIHNRIGILDSANIHQIKNLIHIRTMETANRFLRGVSIHYNYFTKSARLFGKSPAEAAQIDCSYRSWKELVEQYAVGLRSIVMQ